MPEKISLRRVRDADFDLFFEFQQDAEALHMAAFVPENPGDRAAFDAHWAKVRADEGVTIRAIERAGELVGSILVHGWFGEPELSYWIGKRYWGQGIATHALGLFLEVVPVRPLYARLVSDNVGSQRVLEKNGFAVARTERHFANGRGEEVKEFILQLGSKG
jgi:RimJ/RimL family protein N-acetyltransferase